MKKMTMFLALMLLVTVAVISAQPGGNDRAPGVCDGQGPHFNGGPGHFGQGGFGQGFGKGMHGGGPREGMGIRRLLMLSDELALTDQQVDQLEGLMEQFQIERIDLDAEIEKAEVMLQRLIRNEAPEREVFMAMEKVGGLKTDKQKMHYAHFAATKKVLTEEQVAKLKEIREDRIEQWQENRGNKGQGVGRRQFKNRG